jgi:RNA polymerase sigma-70 factor (ECF subfamily)
MTGDSVVMLQAANDDSGDPVVTFEHNRQRLFGIAYRMLGSVSEAEDAVQEAYVRWHAVEHAAIANGQAYLVRLITHLCLDWLKSARQRRTEYIGPWLPEPLVTPTDIGRSDDPAALHELVDDLSMAFLLMLERLTPMERAVFLLHEAFAYEYGEIAGVLERSPDNVRQIARRARKHLEGSARPQPADPHHHDVLLHQFLNATRDGDIEGMVALLADDVVLYADGGGKAQAARRPIVGAAATARGLLGFSHKLGPGLEATLADVNGRTGLLVYLHGRPQSVIAFHIENGKIQQIFVVVNPDKLPAQGQL